MIEAQPCIRAALPALAVAILLLASQDARAELGGTLPGDLGKDGFVDADYCGQCHGGGFNGDYTFLPSDTWAGTMMANAARDPVFFAALTVANQDDPGVGTYCLRCHTPIGFVRGHASPPDGSALDLVDRQGVGCDMCHRATQSAGADAPYLLGDAQLVFTEDTSKHGPYEGAKSPVHDTVADTGLSDARFCGQCHMVTNPGKRLRGPDGVETAHEFPLDTTFLEWASSAYADAAGESFATCQGCHMKPKLGTWPVSDQPDSPLRVDPRRHEFVGGNVWGIDAVMEANPDRATTYGKVFAGARSRAENMLRAAVKISIVAAPAKLVPGEPIDVTVRVENLAGHKFPTGYAESRRAWVGLMLVDSDLKKRMIVGGYDEATGTVVEEPPTHVYRARHGHWNGAAPEEEEHLARHDMILSDTRIPPKGFKATATTTPSGEIDYADGKGGFRSYDEFTLHVTVPKDARGHQALAAQVYYQSMTREHVEMLAAENVTDDRGAALLAVYKATGAAPPIQIAEDVIGLEVTQKPAPVAVPAEASGCACTTTAADPARGGGLVLSLGGVLIAIRRGLRWGRGRRRLEARERAG
jgi:hypothetical protein